VEARKTKTKRFALELQVIVEMHARVAMIGQKPFLSELSPGP